ncbi:DUF6269 family protein [Streptomyces violaceusniger]|uniref:DUF6269 family protein n=1 Tax=Streptomyces violaceusniger TaxID=68280 RepID=UPI00369D34B3
MTDDPTSPAAAEPPWAFLARLEEQIARDQETCLRDCGAPWGELLERFVDALTGQPCPGTEAPAEGKATDGQAAGGPGAPDEPGGPGQGGPGQDGPGQGGPGQGDNTGE